MTFQPEKVWITQSDAAEGIRGQFGLSDAIDYLLGEKFLNYLDAAASHPEFEAEVPAFTARVQKIFEPHEILAFFERPTDQDLTPDLEDVDACDVVVGAEKMMLVERAKELLLP